MPIFSNARKALRDYPCDKTADSRECPCRDSFFLPDFFSQRERHTLKKHAGIGCGNCDEGDYNIMGPAYIFDRRDGEGRMPAEYRMHRECACHRGEDNAA